MARLRQQGVLYQVWFQSRKLIMYDAASWSDLLVQLRESDDDDSNSA